jgi:very-short-patch-repair endonuclease
MLFCLPSNIGYQDLKVIKTMDNNKRKFIDSKIEELVNKATKAEISFARLLENFDIGYKFQYAIENRKKNVVYIVDFFTNLYGQKIVFEIDGDYHLERKQFLKDKERDDFLRRKKYIVLRFSNDKVYNCKSEIMQELAKVFIKPIDKFKKKRMMYDEKERNKSNIQSKKVVKYKKPNKQKSIKTQHPVLDKMIDAKKQREANKLKYKNGLQ